MLYVTLDKVTKEPKGTVEIADKALPDWETKFDMKPVDESFRGKHGFEIKNENNTLRPATKQEVETHKTANKKKTNLEKLQDRVTVLEAK